MTTKLISRLISTKNQKLKGKHVMSFDDFQYNNINHCILNIKKIDVKGNDKEG